MSTSSKVFLVVLLLLVGGVALAYSTFLGPGSGGAAESQEAVTVTIPEGLGVREVAAVLEEAGVIRSALAFTGAAAIDGRSSQIRPGTYNLIPGSSADTILDLLTAAPPAVPVFTVTIPEGLTVTQTLQRIAEAEGSPFTAEALRAALPLVALPAWVPQRELPENAEAFEGMLFPNTYEFTVEATPEEVLTRLVQETDAVITQVGAAGRNDLTTYEVLVLASLIEREARLPEERPTISGVIHNRLTEGQALQIDATVVYGIGIATGEAPTSLTTADYDVPSPWSTYTNAGLPPTPISAPGSAALEAAARPETHEFFYYVVEDESTGRHRFSRTFDEHQQAIQEIRGG